MACVPMDTRLNKAIDEGTISESACVWQSKQQGERFPKKIHTKNSWALLLLLVNYRPRQDGQSFIYQKY